MDGYGGLGYDGPADGQGKPRPTDRSCGPFIRWVVLCRGCADKFFEAEDEDIDANSSI